MDNTFGLCQHTVFSSNGEKNILNGIVLDFALFDWDNGVGLP